MKRAISIGGGGPAVGLGLGVLKRLAETPSLTFDVWACSCIGSLLGVTYNTAPPGQEFQYANTFLRRLMRDEATYSLFPVSPAFVPDIGAHAARMASHLTDPETWSRLLLPDRLGESIGAWTQFLRDPGRWHQAEFNALLVNDGIALNPFVRLAFSTLYSAPMPGLSRVHYADHPRQGDRYGLMLEELYRPGRPRIYTNAYNMDDQRLELFTNVKDHPRYRPIDFGSLVAGSSLPYVMEPVVLDGKTYCEGATVDTVNFRDLLANHPDLEEIWVVRLLSRKQIRPPRNLTDALTNLVMLFAATASEDAVTLLRFELEAQRSKVRVIEIPVDGAIAYKWTEENLDQGIDAGWRSADAVVSGYRPQHGVTGSRLARASLAGRARGAAELAETVRRAAPATITPAAAVTATLAEVAGLLRRLPLHLPDTEKLAGGELLLRLDSTAGAQHAAALRREEVRQQLVMALTDAGDTGRIELLNTAVRLLRAADELEDQVGELLDDVRRTWRHGAQAAWLTPLMDALDGLLQVAAETTPDDAGDVELLCTMSDDRSTELRHFRARVLGGITEDRTAERIAVVTLTNSAEFVISGLARVASLLRTIGLVQDSAHLLDPGGLDRPRRTA